MYTKEELQNAIRESSSYSETLRKLGRVVSGTSMRFLKKRIASDNIDTSHFSFKPNYRKMADLRVLKPNEILVCGRKEYREDGKRLKRALLELGVDYKCEICNVISWNGETLTLHVDHIDGNRINNTKENLRFLCPNCHSLTETYRYRNTSKFCKCGKKIGKTSKTCKKCQNTEVSSFLQRRCEWPTREELKCLIDTTPIRYIAKQFNVSDSTIIKWCKKYDIKRPGRGYWQKVLYSKNNGDLV